MKSQYAPELFRYLKILIDRDRHHTGQFILTGSQKFPLMQGASESLSGRCAVIELENLSWSEIQDTSPSTPLLDTVIRGGFPELHASPQIDTSVFYESYLATYLERDVRSLLRVHQLRDFERLIRACAFRSGQLLNKTELAKDVGISPTTVQEWLSVLVASSQVYLLEPWFSNYTKMLAKSPKLYLADAGLLCHLLNIRTPQDLLKTPAKGAIWETFVYSELRKRQEQLRGRPELWLIRTLRGFEIDFALQKGGELHLIECKMTETPGERELMNLKKADEILSCRVLSKSLIYPGTQSYPIQAEKSQIQIYSLLDFPEEYF